MAERRSSRAGKAPVAARDEILEVALDRFSRLGFDGVSTAAIAQGVGISQSLILYHFETKEAMWRAAMERLFSRVGVRALVDQAAYKDLDIANRLKVVLRRFVHTSARHPELGRVILTEGTAGGARFDWLFETWLKPSYSLYRQIFEEGIEAGVLKPHDPWLSMLAAHSAGAMLFNLAPLTERLLGRSPFDAEVVERQADLLVDLMLNGLLRQPG
ncbi:TetR family transcriptional regulator [Sandaracinobacteroides saxicola]|uniref:TetR family transcriptional regulator n=1 Tax=Sandaracinobacteroides saxicola TaxID=2759707 RepID=A0A7G5ILF9_9SPHN|nr:TetR family transcriptional regulator [Sandaracinobacteroides saxicola]QMW24201.1 TetR family transcriptional regulator [Sandaracinobacteroides saxicola]